VTSNQKQTLIAVSEHFIQSLSSNIIKEALYIVWFADSPGTFRICRKDAMDFNYQCYNLRQLMKQHLCSTSVFLSVVTVACGQTKQRG